MSILALVMIFMATGCSKDEPESGDKFANTKIVNPYPYSVKLTPTKCKRSGGTVTFCFTAENIGGYTFYFGFSTYKGDPNYNTDAEDNNLNFYWSSYGEVGDEHGQSYDWQSTPGYAISKKLQPGEVVKCEVKFRDVKKDATYFKEINLRGDYPSVGQISFKNVPID